MGALAFGCGQCLPCRINRRRVWTHRIVLESFKHENSGFVTLTYSPENLPVGGTLVPKDLQDWLKRLRKYRKLRYFAVGEYGDQTHRPHYHLALFGVGPNDGELIRDTWGLGHTFTGDLTFHSAQYVGGYVTKKMTHCEDKCSDKCKHPKLGGRHPEFARMSLRPGIGACAMEDVAAVLLSDAVIEETIKAGDVPSVLSHGKKKYPLGRYLKKVLRREIGFQEKTPPHVLKKLSEEMRQMLSEALALPENKSKTLKKILTEKSQGAINSMERRFKIHSKERTL